MVMTDMHQSHQQPAYERWNDSTEELPLKCNSCRHGWNAGGTPSLFNETWEIECNDTGEGRTTLMHDMIEIDESEWVIMSLTPIIGILQ